MEEVTNNDLVLYLGSLFLLSLVPKATDILIEETSKMTVLIYGILTFLVVYLTQHLMRVLTQQAIKIGNASKEELEVISKRGLFNLGMRLVWLLVGLIVPTVTLVVYMILPILDFLQNAVEHEESEFVQQMGDEQREYYREDQHRFWGNGWQKYGKLVRSALSTSSGDGDESQQPNWWQEFNQQWHDRLNQQVADLSQQLAESDDPKVKAALQGKIDRLHQEQTMISSKLSETQRRYQQRQSREQDRLQSRLAPIEKKIDQLQNQLTQETEATKQEQLQKEIAKWQQKWQEEVAASQKRKDQTQQKTEERYRNFIDHMPQQPNQDEK